MTDIPGTRISQVATVFVPVADQDRALEFYLDKLGFEKRADFPYGEGGRWVEVAPPGSANAIALVPPREGGSPAATPPTARSRRRTSTPTTPRCAPAASRPTQPSHARAARAP